MLVDNGCNLWKCSDNFKKMELIPDVKVNLNTVLIEQDWALTPEGLVINIETGKIQPGKQYKSIHQLTRSTILKLTHEGEAIVDNSVIHDVKLVVGDHDNLRILMNNGQWLRSNNWSQPKQSQEVKNLPEFSEIVKVKGNCILTKDKLYDLIENQVYSITSEIRDFGHFTFGDMAVSSNPVVVTESGQVLIGMYDSELIELDNDIIKDYNLKSKWKQVMCCIIDGGYANLLINELGQAYVIVDEYGSLRTTTLKLD